MYAQRSKNISQGRGFFSFQFLQFFFQIQLDFPPHLFRQKASVVMSYLELWTSACLRTSLQRAQCCWEGWMPCTSLPTLPPNNLEEPGNEIVWAWQWFWQQKNTKKHNFFFPELHCLTCPENERKALDSPDFSRRIWSFWHSSMNPEMRLANSTTYWIAWVIWMAHCCHSTSRGYNQTHSV